MKFWRLSHASNPDDFIPWERCSWDNRWDDPRGNFRTLYAAEQKVTCVRELLQHLRANTKTLTEFGRYFGPVAAEIPAREVPVEWRRKNALVEVDVVFDKPGKGLADLLSNQPLIRQLEVEHAKLLARHNMPHLDFTQLTSKRRIVTRRIARGLYEQGYAGIRFPSNLDLQPCIAIFEGRAHLEHNPGARFIPMTRNIQELLLVCDEFNLILRQPR